MNESAKLFSFEFIALNLILAAAFCNISAYFSFYHYLGSIDIPVAGRGFLVGLEPMAAFALRLFVIPWIHLRNAFAMMALALFLLIATSCAYLWVVTVPAMMVLRIMHGAVFALLTISVIALMMPFIPKGKSGQGFGTVTVATTLPYAVIPPLMEILLPYVRNEADLYAGVSIFSALALIMIAVTRGRFRIAFDHAEKAIGHRPSLPEIRENFRQRPVLLLLTVTLLFYLAHATVFYFIKDLSLQGHLGNVGAFFTLFMTAMIAMRLLGGAFFDRFHKRRLLQGGLALVFLSLVLIPHAGPPAFYGLACLYGLAIGITIPMLNALLFTSSPPSLRGLNINMTLFTLDIGYFLMPYLGGMLIAFGTGFTFLFYCGAGFVLLAFFISFDPGTRGRPSGGPDTAMERL